MNMKAPPGGEGALEAEAKSGAKPRHEKGQPDSVGDEPRRQVVEAVWETGKENGLTWREFSAEERDRREMLHCSRQRNGGNIKTIMPTAGAICKSKGLVLRFFVNESDEVNAFSHVGGYIYVNKGLLEFIDGDGELEFVLGHEIGHVELQHCTRNLTYAARASKLGGQLGENLTQIAYHLVAVGYSEDQEFAADEWGYRQLIGLGRDQEQALALPRRFMEKEKREGRSEARPKSKTPVDAVLQEIDNHFRTHPPATERLERLQRLEVKSDGRRDGGE